MLLADDQPLTRNALHRLLTDLSGVSVRQVVSAGAARQALREETFSIAILDQHLGDESGATIRDEFGALPDPPEIFVVSADPDPEQRVYARPRNIDDLQRMLNFERPRADRLGSTPDLPANVFAQFRALILRAIAANRACDARELNDALHALRGAASVWHLPAVQTHAQQAQLIGGGPEVEDLLQVMEQEIASRQAI